MENRFELYERGLNDCEIARIEKVNHHSVWEWRNVRQLPPNAKRGEWKSRTLKRFPEREKLYREGLNDHEIARMLNIEPNCVFYWRKREGLRANTSLGGQTKKISLEPTRDLGYLCGLILGDGSLYFSKKTHNYEIAFGTTKKEFVGIIVDAIQCVGLRTWLRDEIKTRKFPNGQVRTDLSYWVKSNSKILYDALRPYKREDYKWGIPTFLNTNESLLGFLQGIFDAEGSIFTSRKNKYILLASKHQENLLPIKELLYRYGINGHIYSRNKKCHVLHIADRESRTHFRNLIGFKLPSKKERLEVMFSG